MSYINVVNMDQHSTLVSMAAIIVNALESYGLDYRPILRTVTVAEIIAR